MITTMPIANRKRPTLKHRLAISPGILGTVYGVNAAGVARYFDFDLVGAMAFAGVDASNTSGQDPRWSRPLARAQYVRDGNIGAEPKARDYCLWILKEKS